MVLRRRLYRDDATLGRPHRVDPRVTRLIPVRIDGAEAEVLNVSPQGLGLAADEPPAVGTRLSFELPLLPLHRLSVSGRVVWTDACRFGMALDGLSDDDASILELWVRTELLR